MSDRFKKYKDEDIRNAVLAYEAARRDGDTRYFDVDQMEIVIDYYLDQPDVEQLEDAVKYAERLFPEANSIRLRRAHLLCAKGFYDKALPILKQLLRMEPDNTDVHYSLGAVYGSMGQPMKAIKHYLIAARDEYALDMVYGNVGDEYRNLGRDKEAIHYYKKSLEINPNEERSMQNLVYCFDDCDRLNEGEQYFTDFVEKHPYNKFAWFSCGIIYFYLSLFEKSIDACEYALAIDKTFFDPYPCIANSYMQLGDAGKAASTMLDSLQYTEAPEEVYFSIGLIYHDVKNYRTAAIYFRKALDIDGYFGDALRGLAGCYDSMGDTRSAVQYIERAIAVMPPLAEVHFDAAHFHDNDGNEEAADMHFKQAIDLDNSLDLYWVDYGLFLFNHAHYEEAIDMLAAGIPSAEHPEDFEVIIAASYFMQGKLQTFRSVASACMAVWKDWRDKLAEISPLAAEFLP